MSSDRLYLTIKTSITQMSNVLQILHNPSPKLRIISDEVQLRELKLAKTLIKDMIFTLKKVDGMGLAAPQVGISKRIIVVKNGKKYVEMINPWLVPLGDTSSNMISFDEGCLSLPGIHCNIARWNYISVSYFNSKWDECDLELSGLPSVCVQHEIDHLNGVLMID
jgi:peptide deformylase